MYHPLYLVVPKSIVAACVCNAFVGGIYLLALLFVIPNILAFMMANTGAHALLNPVIATFRLAVPHRGALALTILLLLNIYFTGAVSLTATSRIG